MSATAFLCLVLAVSDGDTLTARCLREKMQVRIAAIDAPERRQAYGKQARDSLAALCLRRPARIVVHETDKYGRRVAEVSCLGQDVGSAQVQSGLAWVYTPYAGDLLPKLAALEQQARAKRLGLWVQSRPKPPWDYRKRYQKRF